MALIFKQGLMLVLGLILLMAVAASACGDDDYDYGDNTANRGVNSRSRYSRRGRRARFWWRRLLKGRRLELSSDLRRHRKQAKSVYVCCLCRVINKIGVVWTSQLHHLDLRDTPSMFSEPLPS